MIDFHCHLDLYPEPELVLNGLKQKNTYVLSVTTTPLAWHGTSELVKGFKRVRVGLGLHPQLVLERSNEIELFISLLPKTRYVGEVGLDGTPECRQSIDMQKEVFHLILDACAKVGGRILSIHSRSAVSSVLDAIESHPGAGTPVLHWFSGTPSELDRAAKLGCWFSIGPAMLITKKGVRLTEGMPRDKILTETDGPFTVQDGKVLMPWDTIRAVKLLAKIWGIDIQAAHNYLMENLRFLLK